MKDGKKMKEWIGLTLRGRVEFAVFLLLRVGLAATAVIGLSACSSLDLLNALTPPAENTRTVKDIAYGALPRQKLDVYIPADAAGSAPVVVFFYGGEWISGKREDYAFVGRALAARNMVAVVADYRLYPEVRYPHFIRDSAMAVAWARREINKYGGDPERLFVMGHSAGAYNAAMVAIDERWLGEQGLTPDAIRGWIGLAGPYDFLPVDNPNVKPIFFHPDSPPESQPVFHVRQGLPPALLIAAKEDEVVNPIQNTGSLADKLRNNNVPVKEVYFETVGHATLVATLSAPLRNLAPTLDLIEEFVRSQGSPVSFAQPSE
jgi:acetyl esterase/lipase